MNALPLICGNLRPADDHLHAPSADPSFNESMFFNFFDDALGLGGFVRIGNRVNEGHAEMTFCLFLPSGELLMQWGKPAIAANDRFDAAGLRFRVLEPALRLSIDYDGEVVRIQDPLQMREPGRAMRGNPRCSVRLAVEVGANGPMIGDAEGRPDSVIFLDGVGHYQQPIAVRGTLSAGADRFVLDAHGVRDHSWGRRVWHSIYQDRSLWLSTGAELTVIACKTWLTKGQPPDVMGCVVEHGRVTPLRDITMHTHFRPDSYYHDAVRLDVVDVDGRALSFDGTVEGYVPLRHRKEGRETVYLGQAITRFRFGERAVLGLSEYFDAESATPALVEASRRGATLAE